MLWLLALIGCSPEYMEFSGSVADSTFTPVTGFFGGSYIVFFNEDIDCKEMHWISDLYRPGEAPYTRSLEALQITFNDSDVVTGTYSTGGQAPIRAAYLNISGDAFDTKTASDGQATIGSVDGEWSEGSFDFTFEDQIISGDYMIPFCTNLVR